MKKHYKFLNEKLLKRMESYYLRTALLILFAAAPSFDSLANTGGIDSLISIQEVIVKGRVLDDGGVPLPGVNILEKGTINGTVTDVNGNFQMAVSSGDAVLVFSFVGYLQEETQVNGQTQIDMVLYPDIKALGEVVVVGYGTQKRSDVTGSIASVNSENFNKGVVANPGQLLQGKVTGVNVTSVSGEPGASQNIIIRGMGSLRSGTTPLYVIDGFVIDNTSTGVDSNPLNFINPQDIESSMF